MTISYFISVPSVKSTAFVVWILARVKEIILSFITPKENSGFAINDAKCLKLLTHLRLNFSHLNEHKFRLGFKDTVDGMCKCFYNYGQNI